jgi:hypothetical protein
MNTLLLAVDDGIAQANYDWADGFFLLAVVLAALAGLAYITGHPVAGTNEPGRYARYSHWAAALVAFAVAATAFALFLL